MEVVEALEAPEAMEDMEETKKEMKEDERDDQGRAVHKFFLFVNPKSGGNQAYEKLVKFWEIF